MSTQISNGVNMGGGDAYVYVKRVNKNCDQKQSSNISGAKHFLEIVGNPF